MQRPLRIQTQAAWQAERRRARGLHPCSQRFRTMTLPAKAPRESVHGSIHPEVCDRCGLRPPMRRHAVRRVRRSRSDRRRLRRRFRTSPMSQAGEEAALPHASMCHLSARTLLRRPHHERDSAALRRDQRGEPRSPPPGLGWRRRIRSVHPLRVRDARLSLPVPSERLAARRGAPGLPRIRVNCLSRLRQEVARSPWRLRRRSHM